MSILIFITKFNCNYNNRIINILNNNNNNNMKYGYYFCSKFLL